MKKQIVSEEGTDTFKGILLLYLLLNHQVRFFSYKSLRPQITCPVPDCSFSSVTFLSFKLPFQIFEWVNLLYSLCISPPCTYFLRSPLICWYFDTPAFSSVHFLSFHACFTHKGITVLACCNKTNKASCGTLKS